MTPQRYGSCSNCDHEGIFLGYPTIMGPNSCFSVERIRSLAMSWYDINVRVEAGVKLPAPMIDWTSWQSRSSCNSGNGNLQLMRWRMTVGRALISEPFALFRFALATYFLVIYSYRECRGCVSCWKVLTFSNWNHMVNLASRSPTIAFGIIAKHLLDNQWSTVEDKARRSSQIGPCRNKGSENVLAYNGELSQQMCWSNQLLHQIEPNLG